MTISMNNKIRVHDDIENTFDKMLELIVSRGTVIGEGFKAFFEDLENLIPGAKQKEAENIIRYINGTEKNGTKLEDTMITLMCAFLRDGHDRASAEMIAINL